MGSRAKTGSSPLARGLLLDDLRDLADRGIIPARAGFTRVTSSPKEAAQDHPRSRGVYRLPRTDLPRLAGSSPLARGLPRVVVEIAPLRRIIPARAGFTRDRRG